MLNSKWKLIAGKVVSGEVKKQTTHHAVGMRNCWRQSFGLPSLQHHTKILNSMRIEFQTLLAAVAEISASCCAHCCCLLV